MNSADDDKSAATANAGNEASNAVPFARCVRWMSLTEKTLAALFLLLIVITMGAQVFARYVFKAPFSWSEEVTKLALIWMTFMSAAFVMAEGRHITVDVASHRLSVRGQMWLESLSHSIVAVSCLLLLIGGSHFVWHVGKVGSPSLGIPMPVWYSAVSVGLLLMAVHSIVNLLQVLTTGRPTEREGMVEDEALHLELVE